MIYTGKDTYDDLYEVEVIDGEKVYLTVETIQGAESACHAYTPKQARKLAKRLRRAANYAETMTNL